MRGLSDLRQVVAASGIYAAATAAQHGLSFLLLPIYTRYIDPAEYGSLELLTALSSLAFGCLLLGLPSAIIKCYHRDCHTPEDRASVLSTATWIAMPVVGAGAVGLVALAPLVSELLLGSESMGDLVRLVAVTGLFSSLMTLLLSSLRARELAAAFSAISLAQFVAAGALNVVLLVEYDLGVRGVLWGNLASNVLVLPLGIWLARDGTYLRWASRLVSPLLRFGVLILPLALAGWVMNVSDRYFLRAFSDLSEVAIYGVGYKIGMVVELAIVWPFQLAWPATSFALSNREGHRATYVRSLTYLTVVLAMSVVALSLVARIAVLGVVGEGYRGAYRVVPLVALAYALNGIQYCVAPGVHISGKTYYLTASTVTAAGINLVLNLLLIPFWGMMGAAAATALSFLFVAVVATAVAHRSYGLHFEYGRLATIAGVGGFVLWLGTRVAAEASLLSVAWHLVVGLAGVPVLLTAMGFWHEDEVRALQSIRQRVGRLWKRRGG